MRFVTTCNRSRLLAALVALCLAAFATCAEARTTAVLVQGLTQAQVLYRAATTSLRNGRAEEAEAALKALIALWDETAAATTADPPPVTSRISLFAEVMEGGRARLRRAAEVLAQGRQDSALEELSPLKREWIGLRRSIGLYGLVECLDESSEAAEALMVHRRQPADLTRGETRGDIIAKAAVYRFALRRCEPFAALDPAGNGEFRRQAEAIGAAIDVIDSALRLRDPALLERVLGDLKTFDTQLSQRFGG
ncbi:hypothetical protein C6569_07305 [Phreatobacter cathodiphilus]|uniref:NarX-like N-terminal domain-containing protein n=1 Tax=Phreatobacter cathodiphilus TaxID=1868589 RepID=A0A2S0NAD3_9HYPH|nr:hypothetical protein C6569_07305 [Phreatobacter cathodiphilus]